MDKFKVLNMIRMVEAQTKSIQWGLKVPPIKNVPENISIKVLPPFGGAMVRFLVGNVETNRCVSVYLDCYDMLGSYGRPYWELYPNQEGDISRYPMEGLDDAMTEIYSLLNNEYGMEMSAEDNWE